jgi:calcium-dependent protein kinase
MNVKLLDFGSSRKIGPNEALHGVYGTAYFVAPECLVGEYDLKCDVWSIGVILYTLLSGRPPFEGSSDVQILESIKKSSANLSGGVWDQISKEAKDLVQKMLNKDPKKRLSATEALNHPWIHKASTASDPQTQEKLHSALDNFRKFNSGNKIKQAALGFMIQHFMS